MICWGKELIITHGYSSWNLQKICNFFQTVKLGFFLFLLFYFSFCHGFHCASGRLLVEGQAERCRRLKTSPPLYTAAVQAVAVQAYPRPCLTLNWRVNLLESPSCIPVCGIEIVRRMLIPLIFLLLLVFICGRCSDKYLQVWAYIH